MAKKHLFDLVNNSNKKISGKKISVEKRIYDEIMDSLENNDEAALKAAAIKLMESFLEGKKNVESVSSLSDVFIHFLLANQKYKEFPITEGLLHVFNELLKLENEDELVARKKVKKLLKKLTTNQLSNKKAKFYSFTL